MGFCVLCGSEYPDGGDSKLIHESGKRHQKAVERHYQAVELTKKSVFVALISRHNNHSDDNTVNSTVIASAFRTFGEVSRATCGYLNDHAFVEFLSEDAVQKAKAAKTIKITDVIQRVNDSGCSGFFEQIDLIASCIGITQTEISRREAFRERFETLLCQYIQNPNVVQFGSALTGVGTNDSDVDLCLLFRKDGFSPMNEFLRDENELMSCQVKSFRENRLHCEELCALSIRDQTDLIFRILKDIRSEMSGFFKSLYVVSDARCPVIRFWSYNRHTWNLNSYTFTLMFFVYLQYEKLLPVFCHSDVENFFVFCVDNPLEKLAFSMRNGRLTPLDEITGEWNLKSNSVLFVQVYKALRTMRHAMMLSLAAMKQDADSFAVMLRVLHTNTTSTSPMTNFPPMGTAFIMLVLTNITISGLPRDFDECTAETVLSIILRSVLRCENVPPPAKRARFECEAADLGFFVVYKKLWMSRRTLRKKWTCILGEDERFPLLIESLVSLLA
uniref:NTP_transf_2 domain-containing protein n=1 Tax=Angiostrongylus cantonensis TaxID=6313 RepID=A0A0K0DDT0_ANGCA